MWAQREGDSKNGEDAPEACPSPWEGTEYALMGVWVHQDRLTLLETLELLATLCNGFSSLQDAGGHSI